MTYKEKFVLSSKKYKHLSHQNKFKFWYNGFKKDNPEYQELLNKIPSLKITDPDKFLVNVTKVLELSDRLFEYHEKNIFRQWKYKIAIKSNEILKNMCKKITKGKKTLFGIGNWSNQTGIKGQSNAPIEKFKNHMRRYATVKELDEYNTSKKCSNCESINENMEYMSRDKNGVEEYRKCHQVVRCSNNECARFWQRDRNSAINHMKILLCFLRKEDRPKYLQRPLAVKASNETCLSKDVLLEDVSLEEKSLNAYQISKADLLDH